VDFGDTAGHEQAGKRPALIVSADKFNAGKSGLVVAVPMTTRNRRQPLHVPIDPPEGGLRQRSYATCEDVRSISIERLSRRRGAASEKTVAAVAARIRLIISA
jgi:mRNA interferase MazF